MEKPRILIDRCVRGRSRWVHCNACERGCPRAAIDYRESPLHVCVSDRCDGCGLCSTQCPAEAIIPAAGARDCAQQELWVLCQKASADQADLPEGSGLKIPCVKEIGYRFLTAQWMKGLRTLVVYGADCSRCDVPFPAGQEDGLLRANEILQVVGKGSVEVVARESVQQTGPRTWNGGDDAAQPTASRRGFFKAVLGKSLDAALPATFEPPDAKRQEGAPLAFLEALCSLGGGKQQGTEGSLAAYRLGVDAKVCYGCKVCATLCPTGALMWEEDPEPSYSAAMEIDASRCSGCGVCSDVCDVDAIEVTFSPARRLREEIPFTERRCSDCDRTFLSSHSGHDSCPGCRRSGGALAVR